MMTDNAILYKTILVIVFIFVVSVSFFNLSNNPPTWIDEGIYTQMGLNMAEFGKHKIQVAPDEFISSGFVTVGFPVTSPIAFSFKLFGQSLLNARVVMVLYILLLFVASFILFRNEKKTLVYTLPLLATFAPIYGNGKNVLGEVPGLAWFVLFLALIFCLEKNWQKSNWWYLGAGITLGLAVVTKPIFLIILPAFLLVLILKRKSLSIDLKRALGFLLPALILGLLWIYLQFGGDSFSRIISHYSNPQSVNLSVVFSGNLKLFFTSFQPFYFGALLLVWILSIFLRAREENVSTTELTAFIFSILTALYFLTSASYFRYFFPAQVLALLYLPVNILYLFPKFKLKFLVLPLMIVLILGQGFYLFKRSFISNSWSSDTNMELASYFRKFDENKSFFLYHAPELAIFLPSTNYYQYIEVAPNIVIGKEQLKNLSDVDFIFVRKDFYNKDNSKFPPYFIQKENIENHVILEKPSIGP